MRRILTLVAFAVVSSTLALAADWSGSLIDSSCYDKQHQQLKDVQKAADACAATSQTSSFGLLASGKVHKFDASGNSQAMTALKSRADRSEPGKAQSGAITAKVTGTETADSIKVDFVEVQ
jgi:hypothetical protein